MTLATQNLILGTTWGMDKHKLVKTVTDKIVVRFWQLRKNVNVLQCDSCIYQIKANLLECCNKRHNFMSFAMYP